MTGRAKRRLVHVRVPRAQAPFIYVPGPHGGWYVSLLCGHGGDVKVSLRDLGELLDDSRSTVLVGRRLAGAELRLFESYLGDIEAEVHARILTRDELRFRRGRPRSGGST